MRGIPPTIECDKSITTLRVQGMKVNQKHRLKANLLQNMKCSPPPNVVGKIIKNEKKNIKKRKNQSGN